MRQRGSPRLLATHFLEMKGIRWGRASGPNVGVAEEGHVLSEGARQRREGASEPPRKAYIEHTPPGLRGVWGVNHISHRSRSIWVNRHSGFGLGSNLSFSRIKEEGSGMVWDQRRL